MSQMIDLLRLGWQAPAPVLIRSVLVGLAVSAPLAVAIGLLTTLPAGVLTAVAGIVQLGATYAFAGRALQRREGR